MPTHSRRLDALQNFIMQFIQSFRPFRFLCVFVPLLAITSTLRGQEASLAVVDSLPAMSLGSLGPSRDAAVTTARRYLTFGAAAADLRRLYGDGEPVLLWIRGGALTAPARAALAALERLGDRGLDAREFQVVELRNLAAGLLDTDDAQFAFDATLSAASIKALRVLHGGRATAADSSTGSIVPSSDDYTAEVRTLAASTESDAVFDAAEPASSQYHLLKSALGRYRVPADRSVEARTEHSVETRTERAEEGCTQRERIVATMARARTRRVSDSAASVVVNIPAFRLQAAGGGEGDSLSMDVVVGGASAHRTPEMSDSIRYLVFAPHWDVPSSITRAELLPIARRDPYLLTLNNYQIVDRRGRVLPANAASVKVLDAGRARIRQLPGGTNSLGRVKFIFPNADDVYLHDTPHRNDFTSARRDQSHGCVRVADPSALARLLLRDQPEWTAERIEQAMQGKVPVTVKLTRPVPIHLIYATAVARADGSVDFFDDIYDLDAPSGAGRQ